jgi:hypothetical protein
LLGLGLLAGILCVVGEAWACGDKLVVVGRGLRPRAVKGGPQRASILLYADPKGALPSALEQGHLRKDLERAGHRLRSVTTREELKSALSTGTYDLVFADAKAATSVEVDAKEAASKPTVMPTLYNPTDAELAAASQQFHCVLNSPGHEKSYINVVNEALALRAKQTQKK